MTLLSITVAKADVGTVTLTTSKDVGTSLTLYAWTSSTDEAFTVDWGDGTVKTYNINPNDYGYAKRISETTKGQTITITGNLVSLELNKAGLTSATLTGQTALTKVDLEDNELATFTTDGLPAVTEVLLQNNQLTAFAATGMSAVKKINLKGNQLSYYTLDLSAAAATLEDLNMANNGDNFTMLSLRNFGALKYFDASNNPELTTVAFPDENPTLVSISLNDCYIMHFYDYSFPELTSLYLSNNALMELELQAENAPKLHTLSIANNYLSELDVTKYTDLWTLYCGKNQLTSLNVANCPELTSLNCDSCQITKLDLSNNKKLSTLSVNGNPIKKLDISQNTMLQNINISNTQVSYINLDHVYSLREFRAANTQCTFFYFNYINAWGRFNHVDIRNNARMTGNSMNFTLRTLPGAYSEYSNALLIAGSNGETADTSYPTSSDMKWKIDVTGDGTASNPDVAVTVEGTVVGDSTVTGEFGGMKQDQTFTFSKYSTTGGEFMLTQWSGGYYQQLADVTTKAKAGVAIHVDPLPAEGYVFDGVLVNGQKIDDEWFTIEEASTIQPLFRAAEKRLSFTAPIGQTLSFQVGAKTEGQASTTVQIDWGSGAKQDYTFYGTTLQRLDGTAATPTDASATESTITLYGDVFALNLESYGEFGEEFGLWNNKVSSIDLSGNSSLTSLNLYMNPIGTLDLSNEPLLTDLDASYCELTSIDVSKLPALQTLNVYGNELTTLNLAANTELTDLDAKVNNLSAIDLSANTKLQLVNLSRNALTDIDVTMLPSLISLLVTSNQLTAVNVKQNSYLQELGVGHNKLADLDLSGNKLMRFLSFNDNAIQNLDLHTFTDLRQIDCGGNGMDACALNEFYMTLPKYPVLGEDEQPSGSTLTLLTGEEATPNDATGSDTSIASDKGWTPSLTGNGSGCNYTWLYITQPVNGTIALTDAEGQTIQSGDKVLRNSPITLTATPDNGYTLDKVLVNSTEVEGTEFKVSRVSTVTATFKLATAIDALQAAEASVQTANGTIIVNAPEGTRLEVFTIGGQNVCTASAAGTTIIPVASGSYVVRLATDKGLQTVKIMVK